MRTPAIHSANFSGVIAVGSTNESDDVSDFSNTGAAVSVVAPGEKILSTFPTYAVNGDSDMYFHKWEGTSMATPHVAGLASLVWSIEERLTNEQVRDVIQNTAVKLGSGNFNNAWGFGRIQAADAVAKAGWELNPVQTTLNFIDIPENETQVRAIRIDVKSFHFTAFEVTVNPSAPFTLHNYSAPVTIGKSTNYDTPRPVFIWVKYTGTNAGDVANSTAKVRCTTTGQEFDITITANTIARPTCAMLMVLDKSGSMKWASGMGALTREEVLRYSAGIFINYIRENNGLGIVTFDEDADNLLNPVAGPFGAPDDPFDTVRTNALTAFAGYAANPNGSTAIGDGIEKANQNLSVITGYDKKAIIVFTDGHETDAKYIADVQSLINDQVFAVGLGTASQLNPAALDSICNNTGGYLLLTDNLDADDNFKLAKYFLQIQAGVNNEQVVVDPTGYVAPNQVVKIPFLVNEADISIDSILMTAMDGILDFAIETPTGQMIDKATLLNYPTVMHAHKQMLAYYRLTMPVTNNAGLSEQSGTWHMVLSINRKYWNKYLQSLADYPALYTTAITHGVKYTALVHAYSNLRMHCTRTQTGYEPGATITIRATLSEYGAPLQKNTSVLATVKMPDGTQPTVLFSKIEDGIFETQITANHNGIYTFTIKANGKTSRNVDFTREQVITAAVWANGNNTPPSETNNPNRNTTHEAICKLLACLNKSMDKEARERLAKNGIDLQNLAKCYCLPKKSTQIFLKNE